MRDRAQAPRMPAGWFYGWWVVAASFLTLLVSVGVGLYAPPVFMVPLQEHFGWSRAVIAGGSAVAALTAGVASPLVGVLIDRYGSRKVMTAGALIMGSAFGLLGAMRSPWHLYVLNVIAAVGLCCAAWIPNQTLISNWFERKRGLAMGVALAGIGFGGLVVAPLAGLLIAELDWRRAYAGLGGFVFVGVSAVVLTMVRSTPAEMGMLPDGEPPDAAGAAPGPGSSPGRGVEAAGIELSEALRTGAFWLLSLGHFLWTFASMSIVTHLAAFLSDQGFESRLAAAALGVSIGVSVAGRLGFGLFADRFTKRWVMGAAMLLEALAALLLLRVHAFGALPAFLVLFGLGLGGGAVLVPLLVGECFGLRAFGKVLGLVMISATLGAASGPVLTGRIFDVTGSYRLAFALHAVSFSAAALVMCFLRRPRPAGRSA